MLRRLTTAAAAMIWLSLAAVAYGQPYINQFTVPTTGSQPYDLTVGSDGALWFTEAGAAKIGRITTAGAITEYAVPASAFGIAAGSDGAIWFRENSGAGAGNIGRMTTGGVVTNTYSVPTVDLSFLTAGPDGAIWFTDFYSGKIGRITTGGAVTEYPLSQGNPAEITTGSDGALWFTESNFHQIERITTSGAITAYGVPTSSSLASPLGIASGADGALWFVGAAVIGRMTTSGQLTQFPAPQGREGIAAGADGALWYTETTGKIARITTAGVVTEYTLPAANSQPYAIVPGPDGALWFTDFAGRIGRISLTSPPAAPVPTLSGWSLALLAVLLLGLGLRNFRIGPRLA